MPEPISGRDEVHRAPDFAAGTTVIAETNAGPPTPVKRSDSLPPLTRTGKVRVTAAIAAPAACAGLNFADRRLSALMTSYWANFATTGDPNGPGLPKWPKYAVEGKAFLRFSSALPNDVEAAADLRGALCRLFPQSFTNRR